MILRIGTPKTLEEAISNGRREAVENPHKDPDQLIARHVADFQANKICPFTMRSQSAETAWQIWKAFYPQWKSRGVA